MNNRPTYCPTCLFFLAVCYTERKKRHVESKLPQAKKHMCLASLLPNLYAAALLMIIRNAATYRSGARCQRHIISAPYKRILRRISKYNKLAGTIRRYIQIEVEEGGLRPTYCPTCSPATSPQREPPENKSRACCLLMGESKKHKCSANLRPDLL